MSETATLNGTVLTPETAASYRLAMRVLQEAGVPFLVGGAYAFANYTGITRHTKDFDLFIRACDLDRALAAYQAAGFDTEVTYPHWLAKAFLGTDMIDLIFRSGNGIAVVDDAWFERAIEQEVLGVEVGLCPPEEIIWSKAFIMERERFDGADVAHLLRGCASFIDWRHLVERFGPHYRVLLAHLILFGFVYPAEAGRVPAEVLQELVGRFQQEAGGRPPEEALCQGTLLSREQYLIDLNEWGYADARLAPHGHMSPRDIAHWTAAIGSADNPRL